MEKEKEIEALQDNAETQNQILLVALKLFAEKGYFNTSLIDIKTMLGMKTTSGIYQHFPNKQAIATTLYGNIMDSLSISIDDIRRRNKKSSEQLREIVDLLFTLAHEAPDVMRFLLTLNLNEFLSQEKPPMQMPPNIKIIKVIQSGMSAGEIRNIDPLLAYAYFFGIIDTTLKFLLSGNLSKSVEVYQSQAWLTAWNTIVKK
ncbi:MAG: TetR/AcrR family transcriptional regulator [Methylococcaceae bacterium]|jgi:AcrR family transcriptional regulator